MNSLLEKARQKEVEHAYQVGFEIECNYKSNRYDDEWVIKTTDGFVWRLYDYRVAEDQSARLERLRREEVEEAHARGEELEWNSVDSETREYLCTSGWDGFALNQFDDRFEFNWVYFDYRVKEKFETPSTEDMVEQSANHHYSKRDMVFMEYQRLSDSTTYKDKVRGIRIEKAKETVELICKGEER